jgi:hypothetical protein
MIEGLAILSGFGPPPWKKRQSRSLEPHAFDPDLTLSHDPAIIRGALDIPNGNLELNIVALAKLPS